MQSSPLVPTPEFTPDRAARFEELQRKLVPLWRLIGRTDPGGDVQDSNTLVVLPSLTAEIDVPGPMHRPVLFSPNPPLWASMPALSPPGRRGSLSSMPPIGAANGGNGPARPGKYAAGRAYLCAAFPSTAPRANRSSPS